LRLSQGEIDQLHGGEEFAEAELWKLAIEVDKKFDHLFTGCAAGQKVYVCDREYADVADTAGGLQAVFKNAFEDVACPSWRKLADRKMKITSEPARFGAGISERAECPAVRAGKREPALAVAFATDDDGVDRAWWEAKDQID
jgi:hypothetical protein